MWYGRGIWYILVLQQDVRAANQKDLSHKKTMIQKCLLLLLITPNSPSPARRGREGVGLRGKKYHLV